MASPAQARLPETPPRRHKASWAAMVGAITSLVVVVLMYLGQQSSRQDVQSSSAALEATHTAQIQALQQQIGQAQVQEQNDHAQVVAQESTDHLEQDKRLDGLDDKLTQILVRIKQEYP